MNTIVREREGYSLVKGIERAKTRLAYHEENLFVETAARVIDAMEKQEITRSELARLLKVSPPYVTKILRGHANLSLESLAKIAFALGLKWECVLIPMHAKIGLLSLTDESGGYAVRTVETATIEAPGKAPMPDEYAHSGYTEEAHHELRISA